MSSAGKQGATGLARAWGRIRQALGLHDFVGHDSSGNKYYRWMEANLQGHMVERRRVKPPGGGFLYEPMSIPPEWRTWLSKMRSEPPSADELARSVQRTAVMQQRVAAIEERERQRRFRQAHASASAADGGDMARSIAQLEQQPGWEGSAGSSGQQHGAAVASAGVRSSGGQAAVPPADQQQQQQQQPAQPQPEPSGSGESFKPGVWRPPN